MNPELERIAKGLDNLIPKEVDILHEIKSDRIFCSRQAVVSFIRTALTEAYELGRKDMEQRMLFDFAGLDPAERHDMAIRCLHQKV